VIAGVMWSDSVCRGSIHVYGGQFNLPIPSPDEPEASWGKGWMNDAVIEIPDHLIIDDLDVIISIDHTSVYDLEIYLRHPEGPKCWLNSPDLDNVVMGPDYIATIFDDEAETPIEEGAPPYTGRFRPQADNSLSIFDGRDAFGTWRLKIYDWWYNDTGTLNGFQIVITTPEPATILILIGGIMLTNLLKPRTKKR